MKAVRHGRVCCIQQFQTEGFIVSMLTDSPTDHFQTLTKRWTEFQRNPNADQFIEFALALDVVTDFCISHNLPGIARLCEGLRNQVLAMTASPEAYPVDAAEAKALARQVDTVFSAAKTMNAPRPEEPQPVPDLPASESAIGARPRSIWLIADTSHPWVLGLTEQLTFFGYRVRRFDWDGAMPESASPMVMLFLPSAGYRAKEIGCIERTRAAHPASQLFCLGVPELLDPMVTLLRAGADVTIPALQQTTTVLAHVLDLIEAQDQEPYRVLVVEDSPTAIAAISRTLSRHGIDNRAVNNPEQLLDAVWRYRPDLVLMDMHMPHCTGVEATRVLRQLPTCQALPVVYLSSETDMGMQVAALRLGGDQFITKPFNPVLLTTIVKTKIERYREMQRSSLHDGLTGLLNHTASKMRLGQIIQTLDRSQDLLCVAMIDIDHFKSINDMHGHPVGDQVIRNLAWLLKGRLRTSDIIGRYGGEEFIVVLRGVSMKDAVAVLDHIRIDFASLPHTHAGGSLSASFSAGIAAYPDVTSEHDLIDAADNALLKAKTNGRNRIERATK
jgi:diguanylate cyclase (GGDEF)-like protein